MSTATLSNDYQIALPKEMREAMHLHPGQEFELVTSGSAIQLIPKLSGEELKAAITAGVASGKGRPADEVFDRLENKYSKQAGK
ncbi:MAG: AbrB/MazE/SpoVT family DNA-binding domain-containing protein [Nitrosomonadales bacterium]|nr:AbrB/MazE/SpoVT family DNA-binding domain-containing protein [Nitrosomonadales bacterium]